MNKPLITLSIEEFGFAIASLGAEDVAAGLLKPMYGDLSESNWELVLRAASHSLLSKGLILHMGETEMEFEPELMNMLTHFIQSRRMIRAYTEQEHQEKVLTIHEGADNKAPYLYHLAVDQRVHLLTWTDPSEWEDELLAFYPRKDVPTSSPPLRELTLSEEQWTLLTSQEWNSSSLGSLMNPWDLSKDQQEFIQMWYKAFEVSGYHMDNLSLISYKNEEFPLPTNTLLLLCTEKETWCITDQPSEQEAEIQIMIQCLDTPSLRKQLNHWITSFTSEPEQNKV